MLRYIAVIACMFITFSSFAYEFDEGNTYYISNEGDDSNDGLSEATPWKTISKINEAFANDNNGGWIAPGDKVLFRRGDVFYGNLHVNRSGTEDALIEISSYGDENLEYPIISGSGGTITGGDYFQAISMVNSSHMLVNKIWVKNDRKDGSRYTYGEYQSFGIKVVANKWGGIVRNIKFRDLKVSDVFGIVIPPPSEFNALNATGIRFEGEAFEEDKEVAIHDVLVENCYFTHVGKAGVWAVHKGPKDANDDGFNKNQNFIIRNNHFHNTGGSGVILSKVNNALVENNDFDHTGFSSDEEPRLAGRGSGMWVWSTSNVIAQYNRSYSVRGPNDSYGMHIDFGNKNIIYQYNYSEDSAGGFVEILGDNINSTYRFNVSVNDGLRETNHGNTLWVSPYAGTGNSISSDYNYIYNNSIYLDDGKTPDIFLRGKNTYVYNNIFHAVNGEIGEEVTIDIDEGSEIIVSNNLFEGNVNPEFIALDENAHTGDPLFLNPGSSVRTDYKIQEGSSAIDSGTRFPEPSFPNAGTGIFKDITEFPEKDAFGLHVNIRNGVPNIGAHNAFNSGYADTDNDGVLDHLDVCPNTPLGVPVNASGCTELASNNFTVEIKSETCPDQNNGKLIIQAATNLNYVVTLNKVEYKFTENLEISDLSPAIYDFCIRIEEDDAFEQCYQIHVKEATEISAKYVSSGKQVIVQITGGTAPFTIVKNGRELLKTYERTVEIEANYKDEIKVKSDLPCQGTFTGGLNEFYALASNPVTDKLHLKLNEKVQNARIWVYDLQGRILYNSTLQHVTPTMHLALPETIRNGIYLLRLSEGTNTQTTKFILYR